MQYFRGGFIPAIQVLSNQRAAIVAIDDTIGVNHRNNFEHEFISKHSGFRGIAHQKVDEALHHP